MLDEMVEAAYDMLCKLPFKLMLYVVIGTGLAIAIFGPLLPDPVKEFVIMLIEENWN